MSLVAEAPPVSGAANKTKKPALLETYAQLPLDIVSGCGTRLRARDGREYWDFYGGHAVALLGHSHPVVTKAIHEQAQKLMFYSNVIPLDIRSEAAERLCEFAGAGLERVFFCNSGAEANENALKIALKHSGRKRVATLEGGWHGRTMLALAVTTDDKIRKPFEHILVDTVRLAPNVPLDLPLLDESCAAMIVEPIQSIAGVIELTPEYLRQLRQRCDDVGAMLIYDEVQTGMGRLGQPTAAGWHGVNADMVTMAKGMGNGFPIGAVLLNRCIADRVKQGDLGSTFGGGPLACAALLAVLNTIRDENLLEHAQKLGEAARTMLCVGPVRAVLGRGCLLGLYTRGPAADLQKKLLERGFITGTSGQPNTLRLMPPINMPIAAFEELAAVLAEME